MATLLPFVPAEERSSAPKISRSWRRSGVAFSGITTLTLYPFRRPIMAKAIPVLPLVGSRIVLSFVSSPLRSACSSMYLTIRSFKLPVGLVPSSFAKIRIPFFGLIRGSSISGVFPIASRISSDFIHTLFFVGWLVPGLSSWYASGLFYRNRPVGVVQFRHIDNYVPLGLQAPGDVRRRAGVIYDHPQHPATVQIFQCQFGLDECVGAHLALQIEELDRLLRRPVHIPPPLIVPLRLFPGRFSTALCQPLRRRGPHDLLLVPIWGYLRPISHNRPSPPVDRRPQASPSSVSSTSTDTDRSLQSHPESIGSSPPP